MNAPNTSIRTGKDPAIIVGCFVALALLAILLLQPSTDWFEHPVRLQRAGDVPASTTLGTTLFTFALPCAALAWFATPFILRRIGPSTKMVRNQISSRDVALLIGVMVIGAILRTIRLEESLWYDEIAAMLSFSIHGPGAALGNYYALSNHVLHSALTALTIDMSGEVNEPILRTPAMIFGMASIPAAFLLGREARSPLLGILMALVIAVMPVAILESVEARGYSMMLFFAFLATWLFLKIEATGSPLAVLGYAAVLMLGIWSHLTFVFVALGHGCLAAWMLSNSESRTSGLRIFIGLLLAAISTALVLMPIIPDLLELRSQFRANDGNEPSVMGPEGLHAVLQLGGAWIWWAALPGFILGILGINICIKCPQTRRALVACSLGGFLAVAFTIFGGSWIYARFLLFLLVAGSLLIALGVMVIACRGRTWAAIVATLILAGAWILELAVRPPKQPIREAIEWVNHLTTETGSKSVLSIGLMDDVASYYAQPLGISLLKTGSLGSDLPELQGAPDLGIVLYPEKLSPEVRVRLRAAGYRESRRFPGWLDWGHGDVVVLQRMGN